MDVPYTIRPATDTELDQVLAIEQAVFSDPWSLASFRYSLDEVFLVAVKAGSVIGYVIARLTADTGEILNLAVRPQDRRRNVGRSLTNTAIGVLVTRGVETVFLEVRASNLGARQLYESMSFAEVGRRPGYYQNPNEDALVLARPTTLPSPSSSG